MSSVWWMLGFAVAGLVLTLKVFRGIITGEATVLFVRFSRARGERAFAIWMGVGALASLAFFLASLRFYLGPLAF